MALKTENSCISCVVDDICCPTSSHQPHLLCICPKCPDPNPDATIWINLVTGEIWIDGSCSIENCKNYEKSTIIYHQEELNNE